MYILSFTLFTEIYFQKDNVNKTHILFKKIMLMIMCFIGNMSHAAVGFLMKDLHFLSIF